MPRRRLKTKQDAATEGCDCCLRLCS